MTGNTLGRCNGNISVSSKVDREMREFVESEADRLGMSLSEFFRRLLMVYRMSRANEMECERCGHEQVIELTYR